MTHLPLFLGLFFALPVHASTPSSLALDWLDREAPTSTVGHIREIDRVTPWVGGDRVRVRHTVHGLPVIGSDVVLQMDTGGQVKRVSGQRVLKGDLNIAPTFGQVDAHRLAQQVTDI